MRASLRIGKTRPASPIAGRRHVAPTQRADQQREGHRDPESAPPPLDGREESGLGRADHGRRDPGRVDQGEDAPAQGTFVDLAHQRHRLRQQQPAAEPLQKLPGEQERHRRRERGDRAADYEDEAGSDIAVAPSEGGADRRPARRADDGPDQVHHRGPGVIRRAADVGDDRRHHGGQHEGVNPVQDHREVEEDREDAPPAAHEVEPARARRLRGTDHRSFRASAVRAEGRPPRSSSGIAETGLEEGDRAAVRGGGGFRVVALLLRV